MAAAAWSNWVEQGLTSHQTHYRSYWGRVLRVMWLNQQRQSTEGSLVLRTRLQSHQVHPTVLTILVHIGNCVKQKHTDKHKINYYLLPGRNAWVYAMSNGVHALIWPTEYIVYCVSDFSNSSHNSKDISDDIRKATMKEWRRQLQT